MNKDEAIKFMMEKIEEIEREEIAKNFSNETKSSNKLSAERILKVLEKEVVIEK